MAKKKKKDDFGEGWKGAWKYIFGRDYSQETWMTDLMRVRPDKKKNGKK